MARRKRSRAIRTVIDRSWVWRPGNRPRKKAAEESWSSYWTPSSYVVENAAPSNLIVTYAKKPKPAEMIVGNFAVSGNTISSITADGTGLIYTFVLGTALIYGDAPTLTSNGSVYNITNNVAAVEQTADVNIKLLSDGITAGYITSGHLSGFNDLSGNNNHGATQVIGSTVDIITNGFGTHKVVRFLGIDSAYFTFTEITNAKSFIWIGLETVASSPLLAPLFGSSATYYQNSRGDSVVNDRGIFKLTTDTTNYKWPRKTVRVNGKLINSHGTSVPQTMSIITGVNNVEFRFNALSLDRVPSRIFAGDLILFKSWSESLTDSQMKNEVKYWADQLGITVNWSGVPSTVQHEGDSMANGLFSTPFDLDKAANMPVSIYTNSSVSGSKVATMSTRSDNNTIPNEARTDFVIQCGINNCNLYYENSAAQQRSDFAAELAAFYSKIMAKNNPTHIFWGNLPVCDARATQAIKDAVAFHYIYNEELAALAAAHSNVHIVDIASVLDGTIADDLSADGFHPSPAGYQKMQTAFLSVINSIYT